MSAVRPSPETNRFRQRNVCFSAPSSILFVQVPFCLPDRLSPPSPYDSCPSINSSVVKLMDATETSLPKEPLQQPAFCPALFADGALSSPKYGLFMLSASERKTGPSKKDLGGGEEASEQPILIAAERGEAPSSLFPPLLRPSHQSPPPNPWPPPPTSPPLS